MAAHVVTVVGCTGHQGYAVADALLGADTGADTGRAPAPLTVRGLSRNRTKGVCVELARRGAEIVEGDVSKPETLPPAFQGAWGAFLVTDYYGNTSGRSETELAINEVNAAVDAGVRHIVFRYR